MVSQRRLTGFVGAKVDLLGLMDHEEGRLEEDRHMLACRMIADLGMRRAVMLRRHLGWSIVAGDDAVVGVLAVMVRCRDLMVVAAARRVGRRSGRCQILLEALD
jgi:hypothetical protein